MVSSLYVSPVCPKCKEPMCTCHDGEELKRLRAELDCLRAENASLWKKQVQLEDLLLAIGKKHRKEAPYLYPTINHALPGIIYDGIETADDWTKYEDKRAKAVKALEEKDE